MKHNNNQINVGYLRISHTESLNGTSLEIQEEKCKAYATLHGFKIDKFYSEIVSGGVEFRKRPVFQKALSHLSNGSKLVVSRLDRLSRSVLDTLQIVKTFEKSEIDLCISDIGNVNKDAKENEQFIKEINRLREPVRKMDDTNKGICMKYIQNMAKLSQMYFQTQK